jgi:AMP-binding enzyme C-terminal domain
VFLIRIWAEDIAAYAVLKPGKRRSEQDLFAFCEQEVRHFKTPTKIYFIEDLPKGPSGKVQRFRLAEQAAKTVQSEISARETELGVKETERSEPKRDFLGHATRLNRYWQKFGQICSAWKEWACMTTSLTWGPFSPSHPSGVPSP